MLSDVVRVRARYTRSVHLQRDAAADNTDGYRVTPSAFHLLEAFAGAWQRPADRALTLVGPYGAGKSAFAVFLAGVVAGGESETQLLRESNPQLCELLSAPNRRLLPVPIVGARAPLGRALIEGLRAAIEIGQPELWRHLEDDAVWHQAAPSSKAVVALFERAALAATKHGYAGVLLLCDEVGKFLEYAALHPREDDIFVLQELAEAAARSDDEARGAFFVATILHQNADAYAHKLGRAHQAEWAKVGERFREVPFFPSDSERMDMVGWALESSAPLTDGFADLAARCATHLPPTLAARFDVMAARSYPLHPLVLPALVALFRKSGQSHRSLFNFLSGEEAHALGRFVRETHFDARNPPLFRPDALFDYTAETLLGGWSAGALARLWAEAVEAVERASNLSDDARRTLKNIALLGLLRDPHLPASPETLALALSDATTKARAADKRVRAALDELNERHLIVWSRTRGWYRLWEGGDVDIEAALDLARDGLPDGAILRAVTDPDICPLPREIARRHSHETGTLRAVETLACALSDLPKLLGNRDELAVVLCLCQTVEDEDNALELASAHDGPNLLIGIARESDALREAALDVAAGALVSASTPALQSDHAARRELEARRFEAEAGFRGEWNRLFGPATGSARWFHCGESVAFRVGRDYSAFLSRLADATFPDAPRLRNELINRHSLSSAAAAGRRALVEAMWEHPTQARLNIEAHPPELSMYECLLRASGLHRETEPNRWGFGAPPADDPANLGAAWQTLQSAIFATPPAPLSIPELWAKLGAPPLGLTEGVMPPILAAFLLAHPYETTLYREGTFLAEPKPADWELLLRRPEMFAVAGCRIEGERARIVERLGRGLEVAPFAVPVASALVRNMKRLTDYAQQTDNLPDETKALRRALESVSSPEKLLFVNLPDALGLSGLFGEQNGKADVEAFFSALNAALQAWQNAMPDLLRRSRDALLQACDLPLGAPGFEQLRAQAAELQGRTSQTRLVAFIDRLTGKEDDAKTLDSVLALVANRPPRSWTDADEERFAAQARSWGEMFRRERERSSEGEWEPEDFAFGCETSPEVAVETVHNGTNGTAVLPGSYSRVTELVKDVDEDYVKDLAAEFGAALDDLRELIRTSDAPRPVRLAALRVALSELEVTLNAELQDEHN